MFGAIFPRWQALHRRCVTQRSEMVVEGEAVPLDAEQICNCKGQLLLGQEDCGELLDVASQLRNPRRDRADNVAGQPGEEKFGNTDENDHRLEQCLRQRQATGKNRNVVSVLMNWVVKRKDSMAQDFEPQFVVCHTRNGPSKLLRFEDKNSKRRREDVVDLGGFGGARAEGNYQIVGVPIWRTKFRKGFAD
jgi:hypothetical protein